MSPGAPQNTGVLLIAVQICIVYFIAESFKMQGEMWTSGTDLYYVQVFSLIDPGDYETLTSMMTEGIAEVLTRDAALNTWAHVVADTANLVSCQTTSVESPDESPVIDNEFVRGSLIGRTLLDYEAGQSAAQVAFDPDSTITGILITAPGLTTQ